MRRQSGGADPVRPERRPDVRSSGHRAAAGRRSTPAARTTPRMCASKRVADRRPGRPDLQVGDGRRTGTGHRTGSRRVSVTVPPIARYVGLVVVERVDEPAPADRGQQRIGGDLRLELGGHVGDQAQGAVPGLVPGRIVQQDQPAGGDLVAAAADRAAERERVRRELERRRRVFQNDLRARGRPRSSGDGARERLGYRDLRRHAGSLWPLDGDHVGRAAPTGLHIDGTGAIAETRHRCGNPANARSRSRR